MTIIDSLPVAIKNNNSHEAEHITVEKQQKSPQPYPVKEEHAKLKDLDWDENMDEMVRGLPIN